MKKCYNCKEFKPHEAYSENRRYRDHLEKRCIICVDARRERDRQRSRDWHACPTNKARAKDWYQANRGRVVEYTAARRADKTGQMPPWADRLAIQAIYDKCVEVSEQTGIPHEVDHIIPLNGLKVSGLHIPENLQIITAEENRAKSNKFEED